MVSKKRSVMWSSNMVCSSILGILLLLTATSSCTQASEEEKLEGAQLLRESAPRLILPGRNLQETRPSKMGAAHHPHMKKTVAGHKLNQALRRSLASSHLQYPTMITPAAAKVEALHRDEGGCTQEEAMKPATILYDGGGKRRRASKHVQLLERQRETIWAEMRGPKHRVDNTRAFHVDYEEAHPHPPRNN